MVILLDVLAGDQKYINKTHQNEPQRKGRRYPDCEIHCSTSHSDCVSMRRPIPATLDDPESAGFASSPKPRMVGPRSAGTAAIVPFGVCARIGANLQLGTRRISVWS